MSFRITEIWAFTAIGDDDDEGIAGFQTRYGVLPMVAANRARLESLRPVAETIANSLGVTVKLSHFTARTDIETIEPTLDPPFPKEPQA